MYEQFIVYIGDAALRWTWKIDDPNGRLFRCRLSLAELHFVIKQKNICPNTKAEALSRFNLMTETILHDENDHISIFYPEVINVQLERNKTNVDNNLIYVQYVEVDELYAAMDYPPPHLLLVQFELPAVHGYCTQVYQIKLIWFLHLHV